MEVQCKNGEAKEQSTREKTGKLMFCQWFFLLPSPYYLCFCFVGLAPEANKLVKALKKMPMLHDAAYAQETRLYEVHKFPDDTLVLP